MADGITQTEPQLFERLGRLAVEVSVRAQREDALVEVIELLKTENAKLSKELSFFTVEPVSG